MLHFLSDRCFYGFIPSISIWSPFYVFVHLLSSHSCWGQQCTIDLGPSRDQSRSPVPHIKSPPLRPPNPSLCICPQKCIQFRERSIEVKGEGEGGRWWFIYSLPPPTMSPSIHPIHPSVPSNSSVFCLNSIAMANVNHPSTSIFFNLLEIWDYSRLGLKAGYPEKLRTSN